MCCFDKILVNVAAYVIPLPVYSAPCTHLNKNYICSHIYQDFIITAHYYIVLYRFNNS